MPALRPVRAASALPFSVMCLALLLATGCTPKEGRRDCQACGADGLVGPDLSADLSFIDIGGGEDTSVVNWGDTDDQADTGPMDTGEVDQSDAVEQDDTLSISHLIATQPYEHEVLYGWIVAGQPSAARLTEVVGQGAVIVSLISNTEEPVGLDEEQLVTGLGGTYIRHATNSSLLVEASFRVELYNILDGLAVGGELVYMHCVSSNRAGAFWALYQAERRGVPAEEAIVMGVSAGMTSMESVVRQILGV